MKMTKELTPEQRVREEIAKFLFFMATAGLDSDWKELNDKKGYYEQAKFILTIKGIMIEADQKLLPDNKYPIDSSFYFYPESRDKILHIGYEHGQQDMFKAGWRRVV